MRAAREHLDSPAGRFLLVLSCVLVFSFAFHAKVAIYHHPGHPDNSTASKMWLAGGKLEPGLLGPELMVFCLFALLLLVLSAPEQQQRLAALRHTPVRPIREEFRRRRFQRPPPRY